MTPPPSAPSEGLNAAVAAVLRAERAAQEMTIEALASQAEIPEVSVRRYLKAQRHIDVSVLFSLAQALGMEVGQVVTAAEGRLASAEPVSELDERRAARDAVGTPKAARAGRRKPSLAEDDDE